MKKVEDNKYAGSLFFIILAFSFYIHFFHFNTGKFEEITYKPLIIACILIIYVIHLMIFLFTKNPYGSFDIKNSLFDRILGMVLFWGTPLLLGYMLASGIAHYYTGTYGQLVPAQIAKIIDKQKGGGKGGPYYYFHLSENLLPRLEVGQKSYEKALIGQCVEVQYRSTFLGIYRDDWEFKRCPDQPEISISSPFKLN